MASSIDAGAGAPTVLVVDDDRDTVEALRMLLEAEFVPVRVLGTTSPERALSILSEEPVDVLVADYRMPGLNGLDLVLRAHRLQPDLPAILITAYPHDHVAAVAYERAHVQAYLTKPLDETELRDHLERTLGRRPAQ